jgi:hypothetical protein
MISVESAAKASTTVTASTLRRYAYGSVARVLLALLVLGSAHAAAQLDAFGGLDEQLKMFGCDLPSVQRAIPPAAARVDLLPSRNEAGVVRRYSWLNHETRVMGPNQDGLFFIEQTILSGSHLPHGMQPLNRPDGPSFLLRLGFVLTTPDQGFTGPQLFSRRTWNPSEEFYVFNHVTYSHGHVSTVVWYCGG